MRDLNLKHLHYFWVVAHEGSIVAASERLFVSPQTISAQLKQLDARLDTPLLRRAGSGVVLTPAGEMALEYANEIFDLGKELTAALAGHGAGRGPVRVGVVDVVPKLIATLVLMPLTELTPAPRLVCREGGMAEMLALLAQHKLDFILADHPAPPDESVRLYSHELGDTGISFMAAAGLIGDTPLPFPQCLHGQRLLAPGRRHVLRMALETWLRTQDVEMHIAGEFDDSALIKAFGQTGAGIFTCPIAIEAEVSRQYAVSVIGRTTELRERYFLISTDRRIDQSLMGQVLTRARAEVFGFKQSRV